MSQKQLSDFQSSGVECDYCDRQFSTQAALNSHVGHSHPDKNRVEYKCDWCGELNTTIPSLYNDEMNNFCDGDCRGKYRSENHDAWNKGTTDILQLSCYQCGSDFERPAHQYNGDKSFCSTDCKNNYQKSRDKKDHPRWVGERKEISCKWCDGAFKVRPTEDNKQFCSWECWTSYENANNNFTSVSTAVRERLGSGWEKERDEYRNGECEMCGAGMEKYGRKHDIHHIVPIIAGGCHSQDLLMELCRECHESAEKRIFQIPEVTPVLVE